MLQAFRAPAREFPLPYTFNCEIATVEHTHIYSTVTIGGCDDKA